MSDKMTKSHYHEMGHTAYLIGSMTEDHLVNTYADEKLTEKCELAMKLLYEVYQEAMAKA